jgi:hypothetical protein
MRGVEWIQVVQDRDEWRAAVNAVMIHRVLSPCNQLVCSIAHVYLMPIMYYYYDTFRAYICLCSDCNTCNIYLRMLLSYVCYT